MTAGHEICNDAFRTHRHIVDPIYRTLTHVYKTKHIFHTHYLIAPENKKLLTHYMCTCSLS